MEPYSIIASIAWVWLVMWIKVAIPSLSFLDVDFSALTFSGIQSDRSRKGFFGMRGKPIVL
jgi:hypothetical protein